MMTPDLELICSNSTMKSAGKLSAGRLRYRNYSRSSRAIEYLEIQCTCNWLHNCSYNPLIKPLSRVSQVLIGLSEEL